MLRAGHLSFVDSSKQKLIFLGADCLAIDEALLKEAEAALDESDILIGPASDGGYYLLGLRILESSLFENIAWSSPCVLSETLIRIQSLGLSYQLLEEFSDIDDWEALLRQRDLVDSGLW